MTWNLPLACAEGGEDGLAAFEVLHRISAYGGGAASKPPMSRTAEAEGSGTPVTCSKALASLLTRRASRYPPAAVLAGPAGL